jgi:hypothetical protein
MIEDRGGEGPETMGVLVPQVIYDEFVADPLDQQILRPRDRRPYLDRAIFHFS